MDYLLYYLLAALYCSAFAVLLTTVRSFMAPRRPGPARRSNARDRQRRLQQQTLSSVPRIPPSVDDWIDSIEPDSSTLPDFPPEQITDDLDVANNYSSLAASFPTAVTFTHALPRPTLWTADGDNEFDMITLDVNHPTLTSHHVRSLPFAQVSSIVVVFDPGYDSIDPYLPHMVNMENARTYMMRLIANARERGDILQRNVGSLAYRGQFAVRLVFKDC